jgi:hypothetical protein
VPLTVQALKATKSSILLALARYAKTGLIVAIITSATIKIVDCFDDNLDHTFDVFEALTTIAGGIVAYYLLT